MKNGSLFNLSDVAIKLRKRLSFIVVLVLSALLFSASAYAECGGHTQCIAVGLTDSDARIAHHGHGAPPTPTLNFGSTTSASRTIYVAAVTGPVGTMAILGAITLSGANASDFSITGGTCSPTNGPIQNAYPTGGTLCTITVAFNPATTGTKTATVNVPLNPAPGCTGCITGRTISLIGTAGYPDLAQDVTVIGLLAAQTDTAQHFSRAQILNYQHRMESLHQRRGRLAGAYSDLNADTIPPSAKSLRTTNDPAVTTRLPDHLDGGLFATEIVSLITKQSINLASLTDIADSSTATGTSKNSADISGFWAAGTLNFGTRAATGSRNGLDFTTNGISLGFDRRLSDQSALGIGLGFANDKTDIGNDGSQSRANGSSIAVYGSYQPNQKTFIDGLIGVGSLKFETQRYVLAANDYARGSRDGYQAFSSLAAGYEHRDNGLLVSPYARLNYSSNQLKQITETGTGQFDLTYFSQTSSAIQGALGVRAESIHPTSFGIASPRIRAEYQHNFQGQRQTLVAYADQPGGPQYAVPAGATERNAIALGIGNDFVMRSGATFGIDYQILHTFSQDTNYAVLLQFSKNFDERGPSTSPGGYPILPSTPLGIQVDSSYTFDNNVTRGDKTKFVDSSYAVSLRKIAIFPVSDNARALLTGLLDGEKFYRYDGLSRFTGGVQGELQYRRSAEFTAATFGLFARASADQYNSDLRDGRRYSTGISMRQPMTDRLRLFGALAHNRRNGKNAVFDTNDNAVRLNLDYELNPISTIYLGGEYRRGDVVTTGSGMYSASVSAWDDAFPNRQLFSARLDGSTVITTLGYNMGLGSRDSFDFSWRRVHSTIDAASSSGLYASSTPASGYISNQFSVAYLVRF